MSRRYRLWCFTWNNYTDDVVKYIADIVAVKYRYVCYEKEEGKITHTPHLQGYIYDDKKRSKVSVQKIMRLDEKCQAHIEVAQGSAGDSNIYCRKDSNGSFIEFGIRPNPGTRNDLVDLVEQIVRKRKRVYDLIEDGSIVNYQQLKFAESLSKYKRMKKELRKVELIWIWGDSGTGKSYEAYNTVTDLDFWRSSAGFVGKWFDGYNGQSDIWLDELRPDVPLPELLQLFEGYPISVPVKTSFTDWEPKRIIVTSPYSPEQFARCYKSESSIQIVRRCTKVIHKEGGALLLPPTSGHSIFSRSQDIDEKKI